jgi:hypothetical protein
MCEEWRTSYDTFLRDMGPRPHGYSLDRKDNNGNYEPSNCQWSPQSVQQRNRSNTRLVTYRGETKTAKDWEMSLGFHKDGLRRKIAKGMPVETAFAKCIAIAERYKHHSQ